MANIVPKPRANNGEADSDEHVNVVWEGVDCVLSKDKIDSLSAAWDIDPHHNHNKDVISASVPGSKNSSRCSSLKRTSLSVGFDDYNWMRKLVLRKDVPTIDEIRDWSFDALVFEDVVLIEVFVRMLEYYNLLEEFQIDAQVLERYASAVMNMHNRDCYYQRTDIGDEGKVDNETGQPSEEHIVLCEYHNWYHAVSCAHATFLFLTLGGADQFLEPKDVFCIIMGALIHDLDHPGTSNDFEVKRETELAQRYDNDAVLERHSISEGLKLCQNPELDWLKSFEKVEDRDYVEHFITESILATDPAKHGKVMRDALSFIEKGPDNTNGENNSPSFFDKQNIEHRRFIGSLLLHSADIFNPLHSSFEVARDWAVRVTTEFTRQATKEKELQLPVTNYMDGLDSEYNIAKVQISFFGFMVQPLYDALGKLFPRLSHLNGWGERNCDEYREIIEYFERKKSIEVVQQEEEEEV